MSLDTNSYLCTRYLYNHFYLTTTLSRYYYYELFTEETEVKMFSDLAKVTQLVNGYVNSRIHILLFF